MAQRRFFLLLALLLWGLAAQASSVLFLATGNVPAGKFRVLAEVARAHGIETQVRYIDKLPAEVDASLFQGYDAVFIDSYLQEYVRGRLAKAWPGLKVPHVWLYQADPSWGRLPEPVAQRLLAYYANGGRKNFDGFFRSLQAQLTGKPATGIPDPLVYPKLGIYHPRAPQQIFADPLAYLAWKGVDSKHRPPTIAIALHQQYIASEQTAFIDDLIARIEAAGALALAFYAPAMEPLEPMLRVDGTLMADVLINTQIMLQPEGRKREFESLGIPVLQALTYRKGDIAAWKQDAQGLPLIDVPFYLAQGEYAGIGDALIASAGGKGGEQIDPIPAQADAVVAKALNLVRLQRLPNADKRLAVFFWNYPPGEKNLSASYLNLPRSLERTLNALRAAGYRTEAHDEELLTANLQRLLAPYYRDGQLDGLVRDGLAELFPVEQYRAWLAGLPPETQQALQERWGAPERSAMTLVRDGHSYFVVPRLKLGNAVLLPQPPRGEKWEEKEKALYHHPKAIPSHFYLAAYLWARQVQRADALIHFGTHGSQEWLPGKERGLSVADYPLLALGDVPVVYPYIVDDIGEALQAIRRGRAVTITHQTPPFAPAGLHEALTRIHDLLHAWLAQDSGAVKDKLAANLLSRIRAQHIERDLGWSEQRLAQDFSGFVAELHTHLHELAQTAQPLGLHTFGKAPAELHRLGTALLMLGRPFWELAEKRANTPAEDLDEVFTGDYTQLAHSAPYRLLKRYAVDGAALSEIAEPALRDLLAQGSGYYRALAADQELSGLLTALEGRYVTTSYGGDPVKNPDSLPTGRNLYGFDPSRVPTTQAWAAGKEALDALLQAHRTRSGAFPKKLAFSLWSVETMRHQGILEAQALWALGVEPVWDAGGRVTDVKLIPREQLGRPRVDVVLSVTGLYRDQFPNAMLQLARAAKLAAEAPEPDNPVAQHTRAIAARLAESGMPAQMQSAAAQTRIFSSESGKYGTGLDDATLASDTWKGKQEGDKKLADLYLARMQFAYGPDQASWGSKNDQLNLYAEALRGTEAAVLSRSSNLYGMLTTDDPFQYLGGLSLAVRRLDGKAPELYISNLREAGRGGSGKVESAAAFLAKELATRNFHPGYIKGLMAEGYSGTLQVLDSVNNFWGWQAVAREVVRDDQWQEFVDVYVRDKHRLGIKDWFERDNPHALAQTIERMLEAARKAYWQADPATVAELKARWRELAARHGVTSANSQFKAFVGLGAEPLTAASPRAAAKPARPTAAARHAPGAQVAQVAQVAPPAPPPVRGMQLEKLVAPRAPAIPAWQSGLLLMLCCGLAGGWRQARSKTI